VTEQDGAVLVRRAERAIEHAGDKPQPIRLFAPGPEALELFRERFPGVDVVDAFAP
jgi:hypothetical protein